jgi:hypothetical protein
LGETNVYPAPYIRTIFRTDGAALLLNLASNDPPVLLSPEGGAIWELLLAGNASDDDLVKAMLKEFDVDEATARSDIAEGLGELQDLGLLSATEVKMPSAEIVADPDGSKPVDMTDWPIPESADIAYILIAVLAYIPALLISYMRWDRLERLVRLIRRLMPNPPDHDKTTKCVRASRLVARFVPERKLCFETTISSFLIGAFTGHPPTCCLGARFGRGIEMHAWSEDKHGIPVLEPIMDDVPYGAFMRV